MSRWTVARPSRHDQSAGAGRAGPRARSRSSRRRPGCRLLSGRTPCGTGRPGSLSLSMSRSCSPAGLRPMPAGVLSPMVRSAWTTLNRGGRSVMSDRMLPACRTARLLPAGWGLGQGPAVTPGPSWGRTVPARASPATSARLRGSARCRISGCDVLAGASGASLPPASASRWPPGPSRSCRAYSPRVKCCSRTLRGNLFTYGACERGYPKPARLALLAGDLTRLEHRRFGHGDMGSRRGVLRHIAPPTASGRSTFTRGGRAASALAAGG